MSERGTWDSFTRWMKFNFVGAIGIAVQLAALWLLTSVGLSYLLATAIAVETAVLHNFIWHEHFTWVDRRNRSHCGSTTRLWRFNLSNGLISIVGNLLFVRALVGEAHFRPMLANLISIAVCSLVNFLVSDRWVFRSAVRAE